MDGMKGLVPFEGRRCLMSDQTPAPAPLSLPDKPNLDWLRKNLQSPLESPKKMLDSRLRLAYDVGYFHHEQAAWMTRTGPKLEA